MPRMLARLIIATLLVTLVGCTSYRHHRSGDDAAAMGDMRSAVYHYQRAMDHRESLRTDPEFRAKLSIAQARVAYDEAVHLQKLGEYERAIEQLRLAIDKDPTYAEPTRLLPTVLKQATQWRYDLAVEAADRGNLSVAREHLMQSLIHDTTNQDASFALASLSPERLPESTPGMIQYREGVLLLTQRRWLKAEQRLVESLALNGNLLATRSDLYTVRAKLTESRGLAQQGAIKIAERRIGPAINALSKSLDVWPNNQRATELLQQAKAQLALADARLIASQASADKRDWDDAINQADAGLAIDRSHNGLNALRGKLAGLAAADYTAQGDAHMAKADLAQAQSAYGRALGYAKNYRDARDGMTKVFTAWAAEHEAAERTGAAHLHFKKSMAYQANKANVEGHNRTLASLQKRMAMSMNVSVKEGQRNGAVGPDMLDSALGTELAQRRGSGLTVGGANAAYELRTSIRSATIEERRTATNNRVHRYTTQELRPNPKYDRVAQRLHQAQRTYESYCSDYNRHTGHGHHQHNDHPHDGQANHYYQRMTRQQSEVNRLAHELSCTPRQITVRISHDWRYTVETYTKVGHLSAFSELVDTASGKVIAQTTQRATYKASDDQILNANPSVGVPYDTLNLPGDGVLRRSLSNDLADQAGPWALQAAVQHRFNTIKDHVVVLRKNGNEQAAIEAEVDCAILLRLVDRDSSVKLLDGLIERHTR